MSIFTGAGVALVTPFKEDLSVDYDQLEKFIDFQIDNGTDSIVICGTSGEASTMSHDEQIEVVSACVSHVNGRVPVIAGAGANCTDEASTLRFFDRTDLIYCIRIWNQCFWNLPSCHDDRLVITTIF